MQSSCTLWLKGILGLGLVVGALGTAGAQPPGKLETEKWVVDGSDVVMAVNVRAMFDSPVMKKGGLPALKEALKNNAMASTILKSAGIDPFKDIHTILISGTGKDAKDAKAQIVVRGKFDTDKFRAAAEKCAKDHPDDVKVSKEGDLYLYELNFPNAKLFGAFSNKDTIVLTQSKEATLDVIKTGGKKAATLNKSLKGAVAKFTGKETMVMAMVVNDEMKKMLGKVPQAAEVAPKLETSPPTFC